MIEPTQKEQELHDLLVMAQRGRDGNDIVIYCINCAEPNDTDNDMCKACRTLEVWQVEEWLKESLWDNTGMVTIGSLTYEPVRVLKSVDPIAYNEMYLDYCDSLARDGYIIKNYNDN